MAQLLGCGVLVRSGLVALVLGVALGNVVRGVPLDASWLLPRALLHRLPYRPDSGAIDWYTLLVGLFALVALAAHGACFLALRTQGALQLRARRLALWLELAVAALTAAVLPATAYVRAASLDGFQRGPWGALFFGGACLGWLGAVLLGRRGRDGAAFLSSVHLPRRPAGQRGGGHLPVPVAGERRRGAGAHHRRGRLGRRTRCPWRWVGVASARCWSRDYFALLLRTFRGKVT